MGNNSKSSYVRGVFTQVHFRVEEVRVSQVKVLALGPTGRRWGSWAVNPIHHLLGFCVLVYCCLFSPTASCPSLSPEAQVLLNLPSLWPPVPLPAWVLTTYLPLLVSLSSLPSLSPRFVISVMCDAPRLLPFFCFRSCQAGPQFLAEDTTTPSSAPVSLWVHTGKFLKVASQFDCRLILCSWVVAWQPCESSLPSLTRSSDVGPLLPAMTPVVWALLPFSPFLRHWRLYSPV